MTQTIRIPPRDRYGIGGCSCRPRGQAADVVITQAVEHQCDQVAGGGDHADVAAPPRADPIAALPEAGVRGHALHGLDRGPAHQPGTLLGDPATMDGGVGLMVFRGQPGPRRQLLRRAETGDVADLGDEHRPEQRPDTGDLLDRGVAGIGAESSGDQPGEGVDLEVQAR